MKDSKKGDNRNFRIGLFDFLGVFSFGVLLSGLFTLFIFGDNFREVPAITRILVCSVPVGLIFRLVIVWLHRIGRACDKIERILEKIEGEQSANQSEQNDQSKH